MAVKIYDSASQEFVDTTGKIWDSTANSGDGAFVNAAGKVWDSDASAWKDVWNTIDAVSWETGTDEEIAKMISQLDSAGKTLADVGWEVGQERTVVLPGIETVTYVIEDIDNYTSGGTHYHAAVGQKNGLSTLRQMNSSATNSGGYNSSEMKTYVEGTYQTALQNATSGNFWSSVKSAVHKSQIYSSGLQSTTSKVILHSIFEFCSAYTYAPNETATNGFHQFKYYEVQENRIKNKETQIV